MQTRRNCISLLLSIAIQHSIHSSSVTALSFSDFWSLSSEHWAWVGNTFWVGTKSIAGHRPHRFTHLFTPSQILVKSIHLCFRKWEETREPKGNQCILWENILYSRQYLQAQDQTRYTKYHYCLSWEAEIDVLRQKSLTLVLEIPLPWKFFLRAPNTAELINQLPKLMLV